MKKADIGRLKYGIEGLNTFNSTPEFGTTRVLFTDEEVAGRQFIKKIMSDNGLEITEDSIGNIFATLKGSDSSLPPVWTGSHIDTVLNAGMFDGMAGVVGGIEALRLIKESGIPHRRDISAVVYTSEEPTRFGLSCLGSRALSGKLSLDDTKSLIDKDGKSLYEVLNSLGYDLSRFGDIPKKSGDVFAAVELHIEQGPKLEQHGNKIGIVKTICAPTNYEVSVYGVQSHAGGTSMDDRHDAYCAACEIALTLEKLARENTNSDYTTATVGRVNVIPNAMNVIPGQVDFTVDIRDTDYQSKNILFDTLAKGFADIEQKRGVKIEYKKLNEDMPIKCDPAFTEIIEGYCKNNSVPYEYLISGAYHDSMMVGLFAPVAMIFVPSKNGISHSPEEWTDFEDLATGVELLAEALLEISNK